ncbi:XdhC family protein [Chitinophaga sp.]|uniref:XdhC family protein n=1 Tax=Chitinophaga sp. TaxID=1869181 RepID=UPI0031DB85BC
MKEITAIIQTYQKARQANEKVALATVVHVEGSSYRKPGARMLVTEKGQITGAISGGCLEGDALRKALLAIVEKRNRMVTYDTTDEDVTLGVQLGCNGILHILFEYIDYNDPGNPVELLQQSLEETRKAVVLCTFFSLAAAVEHPGTALLFTPQTMSGRLGDTADVPVELRQDAAVALQHQTSAIRQYAIGTHLYNCLLEVIQPRISLIIAGAGNDAMPVVVAARNLGWQVTVIDGRATHARKERFPEADSVLVGSPEALVRQLPVDERTAFVLMTHNYNFDKAVLELVLHTATAYIGCLGPKKKLNRMLQEMDDAGISFAEGQLSKVYGPIGLDIGADTAEEVAIAIIAEVKAVMSRKNAASLKWKNAPIHDRFNGDHLVPVYPEQSVSATSDAIQKQVAGCAVNQTFI